MGKLYLTRDFTDVVSVSRMAEPIKEEDCSRSGRLLTRNVAIFSTISS